MSTVIAYVLRYSEGIFARRFDKALPLLKEALSYRQSTLGPETEPVAKTLLAMAAIYDEMNRCLAASSDLVGRPRRVACPRCQFLPLLYIHLFPLSTNVLLPNMHISPAFMRKYTLVRPFMELVKLQS